jgi:hypothetical protein
MTPRGQKGQLGLPGSMTDAALLQALLDKGSLTDLQLGEVVAAAGRVAGGARLSKESRDRWMAVAMAQKLTVRTMIKKRPHNGPPMCNPGDQYSTVWTPGTEKANDVLASGRTPSGHMIAPPSRRRTW